MSRTILVQKSIEGETFNRILSEAELIRFLNVIDCCPIDDYKLVDITVIGEVVPLRYRGWQPNCLIEVENKSGEIVVSGYGEDH